MDLKAKLQELERTMSSKYQFSLAAMETRIARLEKPTGFESKKHQAACHQEAVVGKELYKGKSTQELELEVEQALQLKNE